MCTGRVELLWGLLRVRGGGEVRGMEEGRGGGVAGEGGVLGEGGRSLNLAEGVHGLVVWFGGMVWLYGLVVWLGCVAWLFGLVVWFGCVVFPTLRRGGGVRGSRGGCQ